MRLRGFTAISLAVAMLALATATHSGNKPLPHGHIQTLAGNGTAGYGGDGGEATAAKIWWPRGVETTNPQAGVYFSDTTCRVRLVKDGVVTTVAGRGNYPTTLCGFGGDGGPAVEADLGVPGSIALVAPGHFYVADNGNRRVREVKDGVINTVAGNGLPSSSVRPNGDGGPATAATLDDWMSLTLDRRGNIYVSQWNTCRVRKIEDGTISTIAGTGVCGFGGDGGAATEAMLGNPGGMAFDQFGGLYIADTGNCRIRYVHDGVISTVAGREICGNVGDGIPATEATLYFPQDVSVAGPDDIYIADTHSCYIRRVHRGVITRVAGVSCGFAGDRGPALDAKINTPSAIDVDNAGNLYIADTFNNRIRIVSPLRLNNGVDNRQP